MSSAQWDHRWRLFGAIGAIAVMGLASGLTLPLVSVRLSESGASAGVIAAMACLPALGTIAMASCLSALAARFGARPLLLFALALSCVTVLALLLPFSVSVWGISRFAMGIAAGILYALGESRILEITAAANRGRWLGIYASTLTGCQLAGPALLAALGARSAAPLWVAAALHGVALACVVLGGWNTRAPRTGAGALTLGLFLTSAAPLAVAVAYFAMFDSAMLSLLPVYGLATGFPERAAVLLATAVLLGDASLQVLVGCLADRYGRRSTHALCGAMTCVAALAVPLSASREWLPWVELFVMGGAAGGLYTLAVVQVGDRFSGSNLISANAFVGLLWGVGSLCGPLVGASAMAYRGAPGLLQSTAAGAALVALVCWLRPIPQAEPCR